MLGPIVRLLVYLAATFVVGAFLAFPAFVAVDGTADVDFDSVLRRVILLTALLLLPLYLAKASVGRAELGVDCTAREFISTFAAGLVLGAGAALPLLVAFVALGVRELSVTDPTALVVVPDVALALALAVGVGLFEETYFRGALLGPLIRMPRAVAVGVVSLVYSFVHFAAAPIPKDDVGWLSGLQSLARSEVELDVFLALVAAGVLLAAMRYRFGHVGFAAGFHAGWVWLAKISQDYFDIVSSHPLAYLEGAYGGTMGYLGLAWIAVLCAVWWLRAKSARCTG